MSDKPFSLIASDLEEQCLKVTEWKAAQYDALQSRIGMDWEISDETKRQIAEIERNIREAPQNIARQTFTIPDGHEAIRDADGRATGETRPMDEPLPSEDEQIVDAINYLRGGEGDSVTILCDNPDFNGQPNCAVECNGEWTSWEDKRFTGSTVLVALQCAQIACRQWRTAIDYAREKSPARPMDADTALAFAKKD